MRIKGLFMALFFTVLCSVSASAADFSDTGGHWAEYTIDRLSRLGVVDGVGGGRFNPDGTVTRAEFLKMIMSLEGVETVTPRAGECLDADKSNWYAPYLQGALDKGLIPKEMIASYKVTMVTGDDGQTKAVYTGAFNGDLPIIREEMAVLTQNMYQYCIVYDTVGDMLKAAEISFVDKNEISPWAVQCVRLTVAEGIMEGMGENYFEPKATATRAQAATILGRVIDKTR